MANTAVFFYENGDRESQEVSTNFDMVVLTTAVNNKILVSKGLPQITKMVMNGARYLFIDYGKGYRQ